METYIVSEVTSDGSWRIWDTIENKVVAKRRHRENAERLARTLNKMPKRDLVNVLHYEKESL